LGIDGLRLSPEIVLSQTSDILRTNNGALGSTSNGLKAAGKNQVMMELLSGQAMVESSGWQVLTWEEVEALKKVR
jgi:hypothetical protein